MPRKKQAFPRLPLGELFLGRPGSAVDKDDVHRNASRRRRRICTGINLAKNAFDLQYAYILSFW